MIGVCSDVHGHLQLVLCAWAIDQRDSGRPLDAVLLCGDVGTFTGELDDATIRHSRDNPCELEFRDWASEPPAPWLEGIFAPVAEGGLGLTCPVIMVHGNHEGYDHLEQLVPAVTPVEPVAPHELPAVDSHGRIRYLPSGWRTVTRAGLVVGGVGGIQPGQRLAAGYPEMAYIDEQMVGALRSARDLDVLITHQGPARVHGEHSGAQALDPLLDRATRLVWFHGHSRTVREPMMVGHAHVVPLGDATFDPRNGGRVARDAFYAVNDDGTTRSRAPSSLRELGRAGWIATADGRLVAPHLAAWMRTEGRASLRRGEQRLRVRGDLGP